MSTQCVSSIEVPWFSCFSTVLALLALACYGAPFASAQTGPIPLIPALHVERHGHTATPLADGTIFIAGGESAAGPTDQSESYDPVTQTLSIGPVSLVPRADHTATLLADGRVLVIGGRDANGKVGSTEIYDPGLDEFSAGPDLTFARAGHSATVLQDARVLVAGGDSAGTAEVYDPGTGQFTLLGAQLGTPRAFHGAALLKSGEVLLAGGSGGLSSAEVYSPATGAFAPVANALAVGRVRPTLRVLPDGKVQIIGGATDRSIEVYDPVDNLFGAHAKVLNGFNTAGDVLNTQTRAALLYKGSTLDPALDELLNRGNYSLTELLPQRNEALVSGGVNSSNQILNSAYVLGSSQASVTTDRLDYAPFSPVTFSGAGWQPGETVDMVLHEEPNTGPDTSLQVQADNQGKFTFDAFAPDEGDLGVTFTLTAWGLSSGFTAQTAFTDGPNKVGTVGVGTQTGTLTYGTGGSVTYQVTVNRDASGAFTAGLCLTTALPSGATASFSPSSLGFTSSDASKTSTLTIATTTATPATNFTVRAANTAGGATCASPSTDTATGNGTLTIAPKPVTVTFTAADKTYDGTNAATVSNCAIDTGKVGTDDVTCSVGSGTFATANASALPQTVSATATLGGTKASNYTVINPVTTTAKINKKSVTPNITANNKVYDGTIAATIATRTLTGVVGADDVTLAGGTATFANKNVGTGKTVTATGLSLSGATASNYLLGTVATTTADITAATVIGSFTAASKTYDGTITAAIGTRSITGGVIAPDVVTLTGGSATFDTKDVGTGKTVTGTGFTLGGADLGNYLLGTVATTTADITAATVIGSFTAASKTYDGTITAVIGTRSITGGVIAPDVVTLTSGSATFDTKDVGTGKTVTGTGFTLGGADLGNYLLGTVATTTADITKKAASVTPNAVSKTYGDTDPAFIGMLTGFLGSDGVTATYSRTAGETVLGSPYTISAVLSGVLGNYDITYNTASFTIIKATLTVKADDKRRFYDDANPAFTYQISGFKNGETLAASGVTGSPSLTTTAMVTSPAGTYPITAAVGSLAASNYTFGFVNGTLTVNAWTLFGFYQPVDMPNATIVLNTLKGGSTVPLKFEIFAGSTERTNTADVKSLTYAETACNFTAITDDVETIATGGTSLRYDSTGGQFIYNWKTPATAGKCYRTTMATQDGSSLVAYFKMK